MRTGRAGWRSFAAPLLAAASTLAVFATGAGAQEAPRLEGDGFVMFRDEDGSGDSAIWALEPRCETGPCDTDFTYEYKPLAGPGDDGTLPSRDAMLTFEGGAYNARFEWGSVCDDSGIGFASRDAVVNVEDLGPAEPGGERLVGTFTVEFIGPRRTTGGHCTPLTGGTVELEGPAITYARTQAGEGPSEALPVPTAPTAAPTAPDGTSGVDDINSLVDGAHGRGQAVLAASLAAPAEVSTDLRDLATTGVLAALIALIVVFPSEMFNRTLEEHHDEIVGWFRRRRAVDRATLPAMVDGGAAEVGAARRGWLAFAGVSLLTAALYGLLDPSFGLNRSSLVAVVGVGVAIVALTVTGGVAAGAYLRRRFGDASYRLRVFPAALVVAGICVLVSRLADFQPGYLYGLIAGFAFRRDIDDVDAGKQTIVTTGWLLLASTVAWIAWAPVNAAVEDGGAGVGLVVLDAVLAALFVAGIEGLVFGLLPLRFLAGDKLFRWSKPTWLALYALVVFSFLHIVVRPGGGGVSDASTLTVLIFFGAFAGVSIAFWGYFRFRHKAPAAGKIGS